jgi:hypothetical protein
MRRFAYELIFALLAVLGITGWYVYQAQRGVPSPGGLFGHALGIVGFLLMLSTEMLYSLRKRVRAFAFGQTSTWLQVHIFTGIVGSYLVLLHTGGKFGGLAGVLTLLTVIVVASGFVGRYIYTAVPRTLDGVEVAVLDLEAQIKAADRQLQALGIRRLGKMPLSYVTALPQRGWMLVLGRHYLRWRQQRRLRRALRELGAAGEAKAAQLQELLTARYRLLMQVHSLAGTRRLLAVWHLVHIPLGGALFMLAFIHIGGALYYATFLK